MFKARTYGDFSAEHVEHCSCQFLLQRWQLHHQYIIKSDSCSSSRRHPRENNFETYLYIIPQHIYTPSLAHNVPSALHERRRIRDEFILGSNLRLVIFVVRDEVVDNSLNPRTVIGYVGDSSMVRGLGRPVRDVEDEKMDWTRWR